MTTNGHMQCALLCGAILVLATCQAAKDVKAFNTIQKLHADLLADYNKQVIPVLNHTDTLRMTASMKLSHFDFEESKSRFHVQGFFKLVWKDPRFVWDPANYAGIESIHLPAEVIWLPDLEVYNFGGTMGKDRNFAAATDTLVTSDGTIYFVPLFNFVSFCFADLKNWPYDTHECTVKIGSWTHSAKKLYIDPENNETKIDLTEVTDLSKARWTVLNTSIEVLEKVYPCCPESYESILYTFTFQRNSPMSKSTIVVPTYGTVFLTLITFLLPPMMGAKAIVCAINFMLVSTYLIHLDAIIPQSGSAPLITSFYGDMLIMVAVSLVISVLTLHLSRLPQSSRPPSFVKGLLATSMGRFLGGPQAAKEIEAVAENKEYLNGDKPGRSGSKRDAPQSDWVNVSTAINRLAFVVYCVVFAVLMKSSFV